MESTAKREALKVKNSGIPRPSKLPQPTAINLTRKRTASREASDLGKENVSVKRPKLDTSAAKKTTTAVKKPSSRGATTTKPSFKQLASSKRAATTAAVGNIKAKIASKVAGKAVSGVGNQKAGSTGGGIGGKQKRSAWDLKGRLQDMEALMATERVSSTSTIGDLKTQLEGFAERLQDLEGIRQQHESTIEVKQQENTVASTQIKELEESLSQTKQKLLESTRSYEHELEMLRLSKKSLQRSHDDLESNLTAARTEITSLKTTVAQMAADASGIQCQLDATKAARDQALEDGRQKAQQISHLESVIAAHVATIDELRAKDVQNESIRRKLHNTIQELKGNIRVFCRVRPPLPSEPGYHRDSCDSTSSGGSNTSKGSKVASTSLNIGFPDESTNDCKKLALQVSDQSSSSLSSNNALKSYDFEFDRVFGPATTQQTVFDEISQLVQSALDGYNVCIFAYGQTGSGKTFTMEGPEEKSPPLPPAVGVTDRRGMIPRAVEQVFATASKLREKSWEYVMEASFLEIYNETIRDLLSSNSAPSSHEIKRDPNSPGEVYVTNLTPVTVTSEKQVEDLLERAAKNRAVAATLCNERSSRSHSVFRLKLTGKNEDTGENCRGTLNLIDLAGSERLTSSGSVGERLKETKNINKSLSNLGNVIMALGNKEQHIPYRNSKLTYLLQNSLGGNSKTLMFVNISPRADSYQETLCSLRFATKVNQCNIGTARKATK